MTDENIENSQENPKTRQEAVEEWQGLQAGESSSRKSFMDQQNKKNWLVIVGILLVVALLFFVILNSKEEEKEEIVQESEAFGTVKEREIKVPETPPPPPKPVPKESKVDKKLEKLKEARIKSQIVIFEDKNRAKLVSGTENHGVGGVNTQFQQSVESQGVATASASQLYDLDKKILQGKLIDATLETAVSSDLPGMVRALVSQDVYAESGTRVLVPRGSRLIGQYNSAIRKGQVRVFVIWSRLITPDGIDIAINSGGSDPLGRVGMTGRVNNHFWKIFGTSTLLSIIGAATATVGVSTEDQFNSLSAYRDAVAQSFRDSSSQVLDRFVDIPPTIEVKQGSSIKVFVSRDLDFSETLNARMNGWVFGS